MFQCHRTHIAAVLLLHPSSGGFVKSFLMVRLYGLVRLIHGTYRLESFGLQNIAVAKILGPGRCLPATWTQNLSGGIMA